MTPLLMLFLIAGLYIGNRLPWWLTRLVSNIEKRRTLKSILPTPVDDNRLCNDRHEWTTAKVVDIKGEFLDIKVCSKCGFFPSLNSMATKEGLRRIQENNRLYTFNTKVIEDFTTIEETDLKEFFAEEIKAGLDFQKVVRTYNAGQTMRQRFTLYKIERSEKETQNPQGAADE